MGEDPYPEIECFPEIGQQMDGAIINNHTNPLALKTLNDFVTATIPDPNREEMPRMTYARLGRNERKARTLFQPLNVPLRDSLTPVPILFQSFQLRQKQCRMDVVHVVLPSENSHVPMLIPLSMTICRCLRHAMMMQKTQLFHQRITISHQRSTFTACKGFRRIK